jgi:hypothetical protein
LRSTFGFPVAIHSHDPETIGVVPLNGDTQGRYPPGTPAAGSRMTETGHGRRGKTDCRRKNAISTFCVKP